MSETHEGCFLEHLKAIVGQVNCLERHVEESLLTNEVNEIIFELYVTQMLEILEGTVAYGR